MSAGETHQATNNFSLTSEVTMPAFNDKLGENVGAVINSLKEHMTRLNTTDNLTHEEMLRLTCDDRTYDLLTSVQGVADIGGASSVMRLTWPLPGKDVSIQVSLHGQTDTVPPTPRRPYL